MRTWRLAGLLAISLLLFTAMPSDAGGWHGGGGRWHHHNFHGGGPRFFVGIGPVWPAPWWYYPPPLYTYAPPPVVVESPPAVVVQPAPVYAALRIGDGVKTHLRTRLRTRIRVPHATS
jgi:hypothetical protein